MEKKIQKSIVIIDCFIHSKDVEEKLYDCVLKLKRFKQDIMLISNSIIDKKITSYVDYYIYDSENRLFTDGKYKAEPIILYNISDEIEIYEHVSGIQRHGLSVMRNLFKSIKIAKLYGYTHFHRVEVDDIMGDHSLDTISLVPRLNFDGIFYFNEKDISFHYMYCSIDFFLENVKEIDEEQDYYDYLKNEMKSDTFRNAEEFVRHNLDKADLSRIKICEGDKMNKEFPDTQWNTETSASNLESKFQNCPTRIYKSYIIVDGNNREQDYLSVLTYNYSDNDITRNIEIVLEDGSREIVNHRVPGRGAWSYSNHPKNISKMLVYDNESQPNLLYIEENKNVESYIVLK